jgi:chromosomal replication initiation ATPase DnaA
MFADRQCNVPDAVIRYMVTHMERNFTTAFQLVGKIDTAALAAKKPVSLAIAKSIMAPETIEFEFDLKHRNEEI